MMPTRAFLSSCTEAHPRGTSLRRGTHATLVAWVAVLVPSVPAWGARDRASAVFPASDAVLCKLPYAPGASGSPTPKPRLVLVEGASDRNPVVSFYGHQVLALTRQGNTSEAGDGARPVHLDAPASKYYFTLDRERMRLVVALKTEHNEGGRRPRENEGVAGNCSPL